MKSASWVSAAAALFSTFQKAVDCHPAMRQFLPPSLHARRLSQNLLLLEAKTLLLFSILSSFIARPSPALLTLTWFIQLVQSFPILDYLKSDPVPFVSSFSQTVGQVFSVYSLHRLSMPLVTLSSPMLYHHNLTSFALEVINQN